jgi:hypothetical protein
MSLGITDICEAIGVKRNWMFQAIDKYEQFVRLCPSNEVHFSALPGWELF